MVDEEAQKTIDEGFNYLVNCVEKTSHTAVQRALDEAQIALDGDQNLDRPLASPETTPAPLASPATTPTPLTSSEPSFAPLATTPGHLASPEPASAPLESLESSSAPLARPETAPAPLASSEPSSAPLASQGSSPAPRASPEICTVTSSPTSSRQSPSPSSSENSPTVKQPVMGPEIQKERMETFPLPSFTPFLEALKNVTHNPNLGEKEQTVINWLFGPFVLNLAARTYLAMPTNISDEFQSLIKPFMPVGQSCNEEVSFNSVQLSQLQQNLTIMWTQGDIFQQFFSREEAVAKSEYWKLNDFYLRSEGEKRILFQQLQNNQANQISLAKHNSLLEERDSLSSNLSAVRSEMQVLKKQYDAMSEALKKCNTDQQSVAEANRLLNEEMFRLGSTCTPSTTVRPSSSGPAATPTPAAPPPSPPSPSPTNFPEPAKPSRPLPPSITPADAFSLTWPPKARSHFQQHHQHLLGNIITTYPDSEFFAKEKIQNDLKIISKVLQIRNRILKAIPSALHPAFKKVDHGASEQVQAFSSLLTLLAEARSTTELLEFLRTAPPNVFNRPSQASKFFLLPFVSNTDAWARMIYSVTKQQPDREAILYLFALVAPGLYQAVTRIQCLHSPPSHVERVLGAERATAHQALLSLVTTLIAFYQLQWENNLNLGRPPIGKTPRLQQQSSGFLDLQQLQGLHSITQFPASIVTMHKSIKADFEAPATFAATRLDEIQTLHEIFEKELQEASPPSCSSAAKKQRRHPPPPPLFLPRPPFQPFLQPRLPYYAFRPPFRPRF